MLWEAISNTRKSVSSVIQTLRSWLKKLGLCLVFSTHFSLFGYLMKHSSLCLTQRVFAHVINEHVFQPKQKIVCIRIEFNSWRISWGTPTWPPWRHVKTPCNVPSKTHVTPTPWGSHHLTHARNHTPSADVKQSKGQLFVYLAFSFISEDVLK